MWTATENHDCIGASFTSNFLHSSNFRTIIPQKILDLTKQLAFQSRTRCLETQFVATFRFPDLGHMELYVTRLDYSLRPRTKLCYLSGELSFPVRISTRQFESTSTLMDAPAAARTIFARISGHAPSLDLHDLVVSKASYATVTKSSLLSSDEEHQTTFRLDVFMLDCPLRFQPIRTLDLVSPISTFGFKASVLCPANSTHDGSASDSVLDARYGYVSVTKRGQFNLHLDSDPSMSPVHSVGIWVSGMPSVMDPRVWAVCVRFLLNKQQQQYLPLSSDVSFPNTSMFLVYYGAIADRPSCFEVSWGDAVSDEGTTTQAEIPRDRRKTQLQFNLYTCVEDICVPFSSIPGNKKDHVLPMHIVPTGGFLLHTSDQMLDRQAQPDVKSNTDETIAARSAEQSVKLFDELHESQPQPKVNVCLPFGAEFNVPDASLLLEEGVTVSNTQPPELSGNLWTFPTNGLPVDATAVDSSVSDSVPRPLPTSSSLAVREEAVHSVLHKAGLYTIDEHDVSDTYDPARYKETSVSSSTTASCSASSLANSPTANKTVSQVCDSKSPEKNRSAIHSILASLPASQLKRLEKIISSLLEKKSQSNCPSHTPTKSNSAASDESSSTLANHLTDAAVNTSKILVGDAGFASQNQSCHVDNRTCVQSDFKQSEDRTSNHPLTRPLPTSGSQCDHLATPTAPPSDVSNCTGDDNQSVQNRPVRTLAELRPLLRLQSNTNAHSSPSLNSRHPDSETDKYSMLLASIQNVLDRRSAGGPSATVAVNTEGSSHPRAMITEWSDSICDYPLHRFHLLNSLHILDPLTHSRSCQSLPSESPASVPTRRPSARDRVAGWLHSSSNENNVRRQTQIQGEHEITQLSDATLISRLLFPTASGQKGMETISETGYSLSSSVISANLGHLDTLTNNSERSDRTADERTTVLESSVTDTDQSVFLAGLVEKYLKRRVDASKTPYGQTTQHTSKIKQTSRRREAADVTRYGGLNPVDVSLATRDYLSRHGILDEQETRMNYPQDRRHKGYPARNATPISSTFTDPAGSNVCCYFTSSPRSRSAMSESPVPNLLEGLIIQQSPLTDASFDSSSTHASDESLSTRSYRRTSSGSSHQILDIEHLRSLPKLL